MRRARSEREERIEALEAAIAEARGKVRTLRSTTRSFYAKYEQQFGFLWLSPRLGILSVQKLKWSNVSTHATPPTVAAPAVIGA